MASAGCDAIRNRQIVDAAAQPWRAIGRVNYAGIRLRRHCTGTLVSERIVLTAAHCLYNLPRRTWIPAQGITFVAGFQRGTAVASSRAARYVLSDAEDPTGRDFRSGQDQDWALVVLKDPIGRGTGFLPLTPLAPEDLISARFTLAGYAGLRPNVLSLAADCGAPLGGWHNVYLQTCSAMPGDSGAPLLVARDDGFAVAGVFSSIVTVGGNAASLAIPAETFAEALAAAEAE